MEEVKRGRFLLRVNRLLHENRPMHDQESPNQKAIRLLNRQLGELQTVRGALDDRNP